MENSYTNIHYGEELRPYTKFPYLLCQYTADTYFKSREGKLLDVCCGRGEYLEHFQTLGFDAYGVDLDSLAREKGYQVEIANVDLEPLPFEDNTFDFVWMSSAIEHMGNVYHVMENLYRILKPGGKLLVMTGDWKKIYKVFFDDADHKSPFTTYSLYDLFLRYDLKNVVTDTIYYLPFSWKSPYHKLIPAIISYIPIDFPPTVKLTPLIKLIKFSRERQILAYGEK